MSKIILFRKNRFRVFSIKFYAYLLQRKIINFLSRCTRSLHSPHRRECSPKIFPFFENRKHNFEKPCAYVCGNCCYLETGAKHGYDLGCGVFPARWPTRSRNTVCRSSDFRWSWCARDQNIENVSL